jgi:AraC family transcriptional regulator of adaptative response/methylated-DNA-[protein]-cysteine methyltransferase
MRLRKNLEADMAMERIEYAVAGSPLGRMLVAATEKGICAIAFGDGDAPLTAELKKRFAKAKLRRDDAMLSKRVGAVLEHLREPKNAFRLPLDLRATEFQQKVWQALLKIPAGETRSYKDVAKYLGRPTAARAVAQACGRNPVAAVVPCHRVVGSDGKLSGYRWGIERKRKLLEREKADCIEQ